MDRDVVAGLFADLALGVQQRRALARHQLAFGSTHAFSRRSRTTAARPRLAAQHDPSCRKYRRVALRRISHDKFMPNVATPGKPGNGPDTVNCVHAVVYDMVMTILPKCALLRMTPSASAILRQRIGLVDRQGQRACFEFRRPQIGAPAAIDLADFFRRAGVEGDADIIDAPQSHACRNRTRPSCRRAVRH